MKKVSSKAVFSRCSEVNCMGRLFTVIQTRANPHRTLDLTQPAVYQSFFIQPWKSLLRRQCHYYIPFQYYTENTRTYATVSRVTEQITLADPSTSCVNFWHQQSDQTQPVAWPNPWVDPTVSISDLVLRSSHSPAVDRVVSDSLVAHMHSGLNSVVVKCIKMSVQVRCTICGEFVAGNSSAVKMAQIGLLGVKLLKVNCNLLRTIVFQTERFTVLWCLYILNPHLHTRKRIENYACQRWNRVYTLTRDPTWPDPVVERSENQMPRSSFKLAQFPDDTTFARNKACYKLLTKNKIV